MVLRWYGVLWFLSFLAAYFIIEYMFRRENRPNEKVTDGILLVFIGTLIGARLGQVIFYDPIHYIIHPIEIFMIWDGGMASHGGIVGMTIALWLFSKKNPDFRLLWLAERTAIVFLPGACLIRLANLINSELVGVPTSVPWAFVFTAVDQVPRHPVVLYEAIFYGLLFLAVFAIYRKKLDFRPGFYIGLIFSIAFSFRFLVEFLKYSDSSLSARIGISNTQLLNLPFIGIGIWMWLISGKRNFFKKILSL